MTTTTDTHPTPTKADPRPPRVRSRRNPVLLAGGAALLVAGAAGTAWLVTAMADATPVLVTARAVPAGQLLTAADLAVAQVGVDPSVAAIPAGDRDTAARRLERRRDRDAGPLRQRAVVRDQCRGRLRRVGALPVVRRGPGRRPGRRPDRQGHTRGRRRLPERGSRARTSPR